VQILFNLYNYNNVNPLTEILQQTHTQEYKTEEERDKIYMGKTLSGEKPQLQNTTQMYSVDNEGYNIGIEPKLLQESLTLIFRDNLAA